MSTGSEFTGAIRNRSSQMDYERIANGLGWFSIGLGLVEIAAPSTIANLIGVEDDRRNRRLLRSPLYGLREIAAGTGILTQADPADWVWGRVAGDLLDISSLVAALGTRDNRRGRVTGALLAVMGVTALDYLCAMRLSQTGREGTSRSAGRRNRSAHAIKSVWVNKPVEDAYNFWRNFESLPRFMRHLESVERTSDVNSRWRAKGPLGQTFEWEAHIEQDQPNRLIEWRTVEGSEINNSGSVRFEPAPGGRGAIIHVNIAYDPPGGALGSGLAKLLGKDGSQMLHDDLRAFKQVIETGEVIQSDASIHAGMHPGQPPREPRAIRPAAKGAHA